MLHSQKQLFLTDRQAVENVDESLPELNAVFSFALVVKSVDSGTKKQDINAIFKRSKYVFGKQMCFARSE